MTESISKLISKRREEIIDACEELYQTMGYNEITLKEISKVTSFSRPTIYNYFQSKEEIFLALTTREFDRWNAELRNILSENNGLTINELADKLAVSLENRKELLALLSAGGISMSGSGSKELTAFVEASFGGTMDCLQLILDKFCPWMPPAQNDIFIYTFFSFLFGINSYTELTEAHKDFMSDAGYGSMYQTVYSLTYNCITGLLRSTDLSRVSNQKGEKMIRTKVNSLYDFRELPMEDFTDTMTEEELRLEIENEIKKDLLTARVFTTVDKASEGDVAELRLTSNQPKYNKPSIKLNLGLGLFSKELESAIIGHHTGETLDLVIGGVNVTCEILTLRRRTSAELNDEFVRSLGIDGVNTKDEYLAHVRSKYIDFFSKAYLEYHAMDVFDEAIGRSDIDYCDEDIRLFMRYQEGDEMPDMDSFEAEDARFILNLYLTDCINRGIDYTTEEIRLDSKGLTDLRDRVLQPIEEYISSRCKFIIKEA